jgi:hypothetical protein
MTMVSDVQESAPPRRISTHPSQRLYAPDTGIRCIHGRMILSESLTRFMLAGAALVAAGIYLVNTDTLKRKG